MNNLTTNLHLALASFYRPDEQRRKILIEKGAFPSDFYAVHSFIQLMGGDPESDLVTLEIPSGSDNLEGEYIIRTIQDLGKELA